MADQDFEKGHYASDLDFTLESIIDLYSQDRQAYWEQEGNAAAKVMSQRVYEQAEDFAKKVLDDTEELVSQNKLSHELSDMACEFAKGSAETEQHIRRLEKVRDKLESDEPQERLLHNLALDIYRLDKTRPREDSPLKLVWERFCIELAWDAVNKMTTGTNRILQLYVLIVRAKPSKTTRAFLKRVSRCFVWGFDSECIMLCRSVIDAAFRDTVKDEICESYFPEHPRYGYSLNSRINAAFNEGIIDRAAKDAAHRIRLLGIKAVHYDPDISRNVIPTIRETLQVLQNLTSNNSGNN